MKTYQLAVYLITAIVVVVLVLGLVPPLLNAPSTAMNAIGVGLTVIVILAAILTAHAAYVRGHNSTPKEKT